MTHDTGFAPNPFHGILSLATCKAHMRRVRAIDDYIAGFTSKKLGGDEQRNERLVYMMRVTKKLTFERYWNDPRFATKKTGLSTIDRCGDNVYRPLSDASNLAVGDFEQMPNPYHQTDAKKKVDLSGEFVLLSDDFFYLGRAALPLLSFKIEKPSGVAAYGRRTTDENETTRLWQYLTDNFPKNEPFAMPIGFGEEKDCTSKVKDCGSC